MLNLEDEILVLKNNLNAIVLSHYYQDSEVQDNADFVGDFIELSKITQNTNASVIVFCGSKFMAESIAVMNPDKIVLLPDENALCSLDESCSLSQFIKFKESNPKAIAVTSINCSIEIKAISDFVVTSSNAERIINSISRDQEIIFAPDKFLGMFLINKIGRKMKLWRGACSVHLNLSEKELIRMKITNPKSKTIAHPMCPPNLLEYANYIGSNASLVEYVKSNNGSDFIVLTEPNIIHHMRKVASDSKFIDVPSVKDPELLLTCSHCQYMQLNTLQKVYNAMNILSPRIIIPKEVSDKARIPLNKMLELS